MKRKNFNTKNNSSGASRSALRWLFAAVVTVGLVGAVASFWMPLTNLVSAAPQDVELVYRISKVFVAEDEMAGGGNLNKPRELFKPHETDFSTAGFWISSNERGDSPEEEIKNKAAALTDFAGISIFNSTTNDLMARLDIENLCIPVVNPDGSNFGCAPVGAEAHPRHPHGIDIDQTRNLAYQVIEHSGLKWNAARTGFVTAATTDEESGLLVVYDISNPQSPQILAGYVLGHGAEEVAVNETNGKAYVGNHEASTTDVPCFVSVVDRSTAATPYRFIDLPDENNCVQGIEVNETLGRVFGTTHIGQKMYAMDSTNDTVAYTVDIRTPFDTFITTLPVDQQFAIPAGNVIHMHDLTAATITDEEGATTSFAYQTIHTIADPVDIEEPHEDGREPAENEITGRWVAAVDVDPASATFQQVTIIDLSNGQSVPSVPQHDRNPQANFAKRFVHSHFIAVDPVEQKLIVSGEHTGNLGIFDLTSLAAEGDEIVNPLQVFPISRPIPGCTIEPETEEGLPFAQPEPHVHGVNVNAQTGAIYVSDEGEDCFYESVTVIELRTPNPPRADFDGDGLTNLSIFRPAEGNWWIYIVPETEAPNDHALGVVNWGLGTDTLVPADYNGDGQADIAVYRPDADSSQPDFWILDSHHFTFSGASWGLPGDVPVPADYDGDGFADVAVYRPSNTTWYVLNSGGGMTVNNFGQAGDVPMTGDVDGDSKADMMVYRSGMWMSQLSGGGTFDAQLGETGDALVPADYDGDGLTDFAVTRNSGGAKNWIIRSSLDGTQKTVQWGLDSDKAVSGDYDGDGTDDIAVYRNGEWWLLQSTAGIAGVNWGLSTDIPVPAAYMP
jgi:hypothetical protein